MSGNELMRRKAFFSTLCTMEYNGVQWKSSNNRSGDPSRLLVLQNTKDTMSKQCFRVGRGKLGRNYHPGANVHGRI